MKKLTGAHRGLAVTVLAILVAGLVAACGASTSNNASASSGSTGTSTGTSTTASGKRAELEACLKKAGVSFPARRGGFGAGGYPGAGGTGTGTTGGFTPPSGGGAPPAGATGTTSGYPGAGGGGFGGHGFAGGNSKFAKAIQACDKSLGIKGFGGGFGRRFAGGRGGFRTGFSSATITKFEACVKKNGYTLPKANTSGKGSIFPKNIETNKKFEAAAKSCESILRSSFRPPAGTATTPSSSS